VNLVLRNRTLIPPLSLHTPGGRVVRAWDFKQKKNLVIAFLDSDCPACETFLDRLSQHASDLRAKDAVALMAYLVSPSDRVTGSLPAEIVAGAEVSGRAARAFLGEDALSSSGLAQRGVVVTDRYGELFAQWSARTHDFPAVGEILGWLDRAEWACDQCGAPAWPADT
jgi:AhpC/TSA family